MPGTRAALDDVDERLAVGLAIDLAHAEERLATDEPRAVDVRECEPRQRRRQCLVGLVDGALTEQRLVARARFAARGEQHQPGGCAVDAVPRHQRSEEHPSEPPSLMRKPY